jgi:hypothetical protein
MVGAVAIASVFLAIIAATASAQETPEYYAACEGYLQALLPALKDGGIEDAKEVAYAQYLANTSGPYAFCWLGSSELPEGATGDLVLEVHPYLDNDPLDILLLASGGDQDFVDEKKGVILGNLQKPAGTLFNYTERFSQPASEKSSVDGNDALVPGKVIQNLVGFIETDKITNGFVHCACRYTGVPAAPRSNENAEAALLGAASWGDMVAVGPLVLLLGAMSAMV